LSVGQNESLLYMGSREKNLSWGKTASLSLDAITILSGLKSRVVWLADVLEVNPRTIYRILNILREKDFPLRSKRSGREVFYWLENEKVIEWFRYQRKKARITLKAGVETRKSKSRRKEAEVQEFTNLSS